MSRAASLPDLVGDAGIRPTHYRPGGEQKLVCPRCQGGRTREKSLSFRVDPDGGGAAWHCHRGTRGYSDGGKVGGQGDRVVPFTQPRRPVVKPTPHTHDEQARPDTLYAWFAHRGIGADTVDAFGCYRARAWFGTEAGEQDALVFPYVFRDELVNRKYRGPKKGMQRQDANALPTLFNIDAVNGTDVVIWVEGEPDAMAIHEAGFPQVVSLKDGAPAELRDEDDPRRLADRRFEALDTHAELLSTVGQFILAGDMDEPGAVLREELARRLGRHRCLLVTWPDGCKDACDVLRIHGRERVQDCIAAAQPYPIEGVQNVTGDNLDGYLQLPPPPVMTTGTMATDNILKLPGEGRLIVVTGIPNSGKSVWTAFVMVHLMQRERRRFLVFSPEMQPWQEFAIQCAQILVGKSARNSRLPPDMIMTRDERHQAGEWLQNRLLFLASDAEDVAPTLDWIIARARDCVLRFGVTDLLIDPWNEIEHQRDRSLTETEYVGRALQQLKAFANRHGCNVWVIAHPTKMQASSPGARVHAPGPYDIAGSANWANKADVGITIHTPDALTEVHLWKARFSRWGRRGSKAELEYQGITGRYATPLQAGDAQ